MIITEIIQALGDALAEKGSTEAKITADAIQQEIEAKRLDKFNLDAFEINGEGGIGPTVTTIARVVFQLNTQQIQSKVDRLEEKTARECILGHVDLMKMAELHQEAQILKDEGKTIGEEYPMKDPYTAMMAMIRVVSPTGLVREHEIISKFLKEINGELSYIKRVEIAIAAQGRIDRIREADANARSKEAKRAEVLMTTTTQTKSDEPEAKGAFEEKRTKESKPNQRNVKRQEVEMKAVRKHGLCRKQLMKIIRDRMTPKEAMEACRKERDDGQCKF